MPDLATPTQPADPGWLEPGGTADPGGDVVVPVGLLVAIFVAVVVLAIGYVAWTLARIRIVNEELR